MATDVEVLNKLGDAAAATATPAPPAPTVVEEPKVPPVAEPGQPTPVEKPTTEGTPTPVAPPEPEELELDLDEPAEASGDFDQFKPVYESHPELKGKLKQIIGREAAYSELGTFSEVKQIVERVPTLEDAETLASQAESHRVLGETFRNSPAEFTERLKEIDPLAFTQFASSLPEVLREEAPDIWRTHAIAFTSEVLGNAFSMAQQSNDTDLAAAVRLVHQALGLSAAPSRAPAVAPELAKLRREKAEREQADTEAQFQTFWDGTDKAIIDSSVATIEDQLRKALPTATQAHLDRMKGEAWEKVLAVLGAQPQTTAQIETFRKNALKGRMGNAEFRQIVAYGTGRAKLVIPKVVRSVISEWTKDVLKLNSETIEKKKAIATNTRDAGTGPQGTTAAGGTPTPAKPGVRTMDDVYRELENKTYVAPTLRS